LVSILIRLESKGPILYRQLRVGKDGRVFELLKFRSMFEGAEDGSGPIWAQENDQRITYVGRVIRTLRIDEIPQFWNILKGEMNF
ncbi:sugar transferase, partial [Escherichia coli]|nr:sugar transferase [Escherichia coli]